jgi:prevent-host-death family protein
MQKVGLFQAKNRLSELVDRAAQGERIGITRRGKLAAVIVPARPKVSLKEVFDDMERIRKHTKLPRGVSVGELIEEGRV